MLSKKLRRKLLSERSSYPDDPFDGTPKFRPLERTEKRARPDDKPGQHLTARELDILRILTSPEWSRGPFAGTAVNVQQLENRELPMDSRETQEVEEQESREVGAEDKVVAGTSHENSRTDPAADNENVEDPEDDRETIANDEEWPSGGVGERENAYVSAEPSGKIAENAGESAAESLGSRSGGHGSEADNDGEYNRKDAVAAAADRPSSALCVGAAVAPSSESSRETGSCSCESSLSTSSEDESCGCSGSSRRSVPRDHSKKQEPILNYENCVMPDYSSSETMLTSKTAFMERFDLDLFNKYYDSETIDSSSMLSNIPTMTQMIRQNKSVEKQESNQTVLLEAIEMILENTKITLGSLLVEGLYMVAKDHRDDPFRYLGQWLLIQADIRDEKLK